MSDCKTIFGFTQPTDLMLIDKEQADRLISERKFMCGYNTPESAELKARACEVEDPVIWVKSEASNIWFRW